MCVARRPDSGKCVLNEPLQSAMVQPAIVLGSPRGLRLKQHAGYFFLCFFLVLSFFFFPLPFFLLKNRMPVQPTLPWRQLQIQLPQPKMRSGTVSSRSFFSSQHPVHHFFALSFLFSIPGFLFLSPLAVSPCSLLQLRLLLLRPPPCNPILKAVLSEHQ